MIFNKVNNKAYVGSSINSIEQRWSRHRGDLRRGKHASPQLQAAWNKHGEDAFIFTILGRYPANEVIELEQSWITVLKTLDREFGYNSAIPGQSPMAGRKHSAKTKQLWLDSARGSFAKPYVAKSNTRTKSCKALHSNLTLESVAEIRNSKESGKVLATRFGITHQYVSKIRLNQRWVLKP